MTGSDVPRPSKSSEGTPDTELLIIGAGPFGLALAAYSQHLGIPHRVVGRPMEFWHSNMPEGMYLRSACDWHLDPTGHATIERFLSERGQTSADVEPLSRAFYLAYTEWFRQQQKIDPLPMYVQQLDSVQPDDPDAHLFRATLEDGQSITARNVVLAVGFKYFKYEPQALLERLPAGRFSHTCDLVDFNSLAGKRVLILGGRQSAFEWAALLHEAGASAVHVSHRHDSPAFAAADWSWVEPLVEAMVDDPAWFRRLSLQEQQEVSHRLWAEGRLKVEPWLEPRVRRDSVHLWPRTELAASEELKDGTLRVTFHSGESVEIDHIVLATGYRVRLEQVPLLAAGNLLPQLLTHDGFPVLDEHFQTSVPGLYITSLAAGQAFGPFFGFTISVRTSARLIGQAVSDALKVHLQPTHSQEGAL
ncbi:NAD(P)-binding domain-containing protein [Deinococcus ruber]|nr:NAD(P)-binding domain-containing protein [Deinococcus ruber]